MNYEVYTDGSCKGNGKEGTVGGWAYVIPKDADGHIAYNCRVKLNTTNNEMELTAVAEALTKCSSFMEKTDTVTVYSDSAYIINCYKQGWYKKWVTNGWETSKKQPVKNKELWQKIIPYFKDRRFSFEKVAGHAGVKWNEYVDNLAQKEADKIKTEMEDSLG